MKYRIILLYTYIGFLSGITSYFLAAFLPTFIFSFNYSYSNILDYLYYAPGFIFASMVTVYSTWIMNKHINPVKIFLWLFLSTLGYIVAIYSVFFMYLFHHGPLYSNSLDSGMFGLLYFFIGGSIGTAIMLLGYHNTWYVLTKRDFMILMVFGGLLSTSWFMYSDQEIFPQIFRRTNWFGTDHSGFFCLLFIWQTGMAIALGLLENRNQK